jgi:hypothetical protein
MRKLACCLLLVAVPPVVGAQMPGGARVIAGASRVLDAGNQGSGFHVAAVVPMGTPITGLQVSGIAFAMNGSTSGSPFQCTMVQQIFCLGRSERLKAGSIGIGAEHGLLLLGISAYTRAQLGWYVEHVDASELEGPTTICVIGGQLVSCPDNPPFQQHAGSETLFGPGVAVALGTERRWWRTRLSLELSYHQYQTPGRRTQLGWVSAGIGF